MAVISSFLLQTVQRADKVNFKTAAHFYFQMERDNAGRRARRPAETGKINLIYFASLGVGIC